jgi:hypothetical protein
MQSAEPHVATPDTGRSECSVPESQCLISTPNPQSPILNSDSYFPCFCTLAAGSMVRISKMAIMGRKRMNRSSSVRNSPIVPI